MLKVRTSVMNGTFEQDHIALAQSTRGQQRRAAQRTFNGRLILPLRSRRY